MQSHSCLNMCLYMYVCPHFNFWTRRSVLIKLLCHRRPLLQSVMSACGTYCIFPIFSCARFKTNDLLHEIHWNHMATWKWQVGFGHRAAGGARAETIRHGKYKINSFICTSQFFLLSFLTRWIFKFKYRHSFMQTLYNDTFIHFNMITHFARIQNTVQGFRNSLTR
jgi:hypothetical protein